MRPLIPNTVIEPRTHEYYQELDRARRQRLKWISPPRARAMTAAQRRQWFGAPPTPLEREKHTWRHQDIKF